MLYQHLLGKTPAKAGKTPLIRFRIWASKKHPRRGGEDEDAEK